MTSTPEKPLRRRNWRRIVLTLIAISAFVAVPFFVTRPTSAGPASGENLVGLATTKPTGKTLRLGTFNIDGGKGLDGNVDLERTAKSLMKLDFIGLNEVHATGDDNFESQMDPIAKQLKLPYLFVPAERQWGHNSFGNGILTDLEMKHWSRVVLPSRFLAAKRNYLLSDVLWNGKTVHFITTHTDWKPGGHDQFDEVVRQFLTLPAPVVLMGDLNTPPSDGRIKALLKQPGIEEAIDSFLGPQPKRVDWIFLRGLKTVDAGIVDTKASDHPAYWAQVAIK